MTYPYSVNTSHRKRFTIFYFYTYFLCNVTFDNNIHKVGKNLSSSASPTVESNFSFRKERTTKYTNLYLMRRAAVWDQRLYKDSLTLQRTTMCHGGSKILTERTLFLNIFNTSWKRWIHIFFYLNYTVFYLLNVVEVVSFFSQTKSIAPLGIAGNGNDCTGNGKLHSPRCGCWLDSCCLGVGLSVGLNIWRQPAARNCLFFFTTERHGLKNSGWDSPSDQTNFFLWVSSATGEKSGKLQHCCFNLLIHTEGEFD